MKTTHIIAIIFIFLCTCVGWAILGGALTARTMAASSQLNTQVTKNWGPPLVQSHPSFYTLAPTAARSRKPLLPESSEVKVTLHYSPKSKGLLNYRTYEAEFEASYTLKNPTPIPQSVFATFKLPDVRARYDAFSVMLGDKLTDKAPTSGTLTDSLELKPDSSAVITVKYRASGLDTWRYEFDGTQRVKQFKLAMLTNFAAINFPDDTASANGERSLAKDGVTLAWNFDDVIGARAIGMDMPKMLNAGPVASRIAFFAPVSLLFFFAVVLIMALTMQVPLHPMHWFFLSAGCFAFQLLFAYLVDLVPALPSFAIAAAVSLAMVTSYLWRVAGASFAKVSALAQFAYMVLFSYSFFFDGITGITITIGAIITLGVLMFKTTHTDWSKLFGREQMLPPALTVTE